MAKDTKVQELIINELTKSRYEQMKDSGTLNENELYMVTDEEYVSPEDLATVATTGDYNDLTNTPDLATVATTGDYNDLTNTPDLATVATSGDYNDLTHTLTAGIGISIDNGVINNTQTSAEWGNIEGDITEQSDLQNALGEKSKVSIVDWETDTTTDLETLIINKLSKQQYDQLPEKADDELYMITSTEDDRIIVDDELDGESENPVQNKVITTALSEKVDSSSLATVATSGDYADLTNTPTIPVVDQTYNASSNNAQSGVAVAEALETVTIDIDNDTITRNNSEELQSVGIINPRTNTSLKIWEGTEDQWINGEATPWYYWEHVNWNDRTYVDYLALKNIAYGNGKFVAVGFSGQSGKFLLSSDGINWTPVSVTNSEIQDIAYGNGKFIAVGYRGVILSSTDGSNWTEETSGTTNWFMGINYCNDRFIAVGSNGTISSSTDGSNWNEETLGVSVNLRDVTYGNGKYIIIGNSGTILSSTDGSNWTAEMSGVSGPLSNIVFGGNKFIVVGSSGIILSSTNGSTWTVETSGISNELSDITYGNNKYVALGGNYDISSDEGETYIISSTDGSTWKQEYYDSFSGSSHQLSGIIYGDNKFVAVGMGSTILDSSESVCFTTESAPTTASTVYSAPNTISALTITNVGTGTITLSDTNTYTYNLNGNETTYSSIGELHPDWLCNIEGVGVKIGNTLIANNTTSAEWGNITGTLSDQTDLQNALSEKVDSSSLATVATTGDYTDLSNTPTLANVATSGDYNDLTNTPDLANVATSGDYNDLTNKLTAGTLINIDSNNEISTSASKVSYKDWDGSSSTTTDISNLVINNLTQEEYDDLVENDQINDNELYMILNSNYVTQSELEEVLSGKQDTLTAGAGISINNNVISTNGNVIKIVDDTPLIPEDGVVYFIKESE